MRRLLLILAAVATTLPVYLRSDACADETSPPRESARPWLTDYKTARELAISEQRMLLIYFRASGDTATRSEFEDRTLLHPDVRQLSEAYVRLRVPVSATIAKDNGRVTLLRHSAFQNMNGRAGLAIVDYVHTDTPYYGHTVSCLPFEQSVYYAPDYHGSMSVRTFLDLPPGSITQRTMVYAVRMHPESPASVTGTPNPYLFESARQHSGDQAYRQLQGHHNWDSRFQRILGRLGGKLPVEVCAESWPGKGLVAACIDCVHSWRSSSGHWNAVRSRQPSYGYDIARGNNGIWYATGIFGGAPTRTRRR